MDKTLISELEYLIDLNLIDHPEVHNLVIRSIKELKRNKRDIDCLDKQLSMNAGKVISAQGATNE